MAKATATAKTKEESGLVEVEHVHDASDATFYGPGFRVQFVDGKAEVPAEVVELLKEVGIIK